MISQHKLWAKFRRENDGLTQISIVPVLFWETTMEETYHKAYVIIPPGSRQDGYAMPFDESLVRISLGEIDGFVRDENLSSEVEKLKGWVDKDSDNRSLYVYP